VILALRGAKHQGKATTHIQKIGTRATKAKAAATPCKCYRAKQRHDKKPPVAFGERKKSLLV